MEKLKVLLTTEGTYPFHQGGVSTWCDILVKKLDTIEYVIYSVMMDPFVSLSFNIPKGSQLIKMPLWGTEEPSEHLQTPFSITYLKKKRTTRKVVKTLFIPLFKELILEFLKMEKNPENLADIMLKLHYYFQEYEYKESFKSEETWDEYKQLITIHVRKETGGLPEPDLFSLTQSLGWVYRFLNILSTPIPRVNVSHSSAAAFCGIPAILAKLEYKTPILLTEHGVYLREQYLSLANRKLSSFLNLFLVRFIHSITTLNYHMADQVSPVCRYNTRWEKKFGVPKENINVIYNGVDKKSFSNVRRTKQSRPTVVAVCRIDPIKDLHTLIKAIQVVKETIPNICLLIYGSVSVPDYYDECLALTKELELEDNVIFAGHTNNVVQAYQSGDVVALSSISEAFPYSVIEAMMCGKAVVTTNVGGIPEALGDTGILVDPKQPELFAQALLKLLGNEPLRLHLGEEARRRALDYFTLDQVLQHHYRTYVKLSLKSEWQDQKSKDAAFRMSLREIAEARFSESSENNTAIQKTYIEKAYLFLHLGYDHEALDFFERGISSNPSSPAVPVYLSEIAKLRGQEGNLSQAIHELEKIQVLLS